MPLAHHAGWRASGLFGVGDTHTRGKMYYRDREGGRLIKLSGPKLLSPNGLTEHQWTGQGIGVWLSLSEADDSCLILKLAKR